MMLLLESTWTRTRQEAVCRHVPMAMDGSDDVAAFAQPPGPVRGTARRAHRPQRDPGDVSQLGVNAAL